VGQALACQGRATLAWQAKACPTHAAQPTRNGQTPGTGFSLSIRAQLGRPPSALSAPFGRPPSDVLPASTLHPLSASLRRSQRLRVSAGYTISRTPGTPSLRARIANFGEQGYTRWTIRPLRAARRAKGNC
jgi:hypothetical protein